MVSFLEQAATTVAGARLSGASGYDVIYLRDADPFVFIPFVLSLFSRGRRWALSLAGTVGKGLYGSLPNRLIASPVIWGPVYRRAVSRNRFVLLCESEYVRQYLEEEFMRAMFSGKVEVLPPKIEKAATYVSKKEARRHLGLPDDGFVLLHFGTLHPGKDVETVVKGLRDLPGVFLVHAGEVAGGGDPGRLVELHGISARATVIDRYVPEDEKRLFFCAADAIALSYRADFMQSVSMLWEAARFSVPAIASDVGELGEAVKRYGVGLVFEAEDPRSFAGSLSRFMALGDDAREAMARNCEELCDEFPTDDWTRRLVGILEGLSTED